MSGQVDDVVEEPDNDEPMKPVFEIFFANTYNPNLAWTSHLLNGDQSSAEEIVTEAYVRAYRRWDEIDTPEPWIRTVIFREVAAYWRKGKRWSIRLRLLTSDGHAQEDPAAAVATRDSVRQVLAEIDKLPHKQRLAALAFWQAELPLPEIAAALGCSEESVRTHLRRAKARLHAKFGEKGEWLGATAWNMEGGLA